MPCLCAVLWAAFVASWTLCRKFRCCATSSYVSGLGPASVVDLLGRVTRLYNHLRWPEELRGFDPRAEFRSRDCVYIFSCTNAVRTRMSLTQTTCQCLSCILASATKYLRHMAPCACAISPVEVLLLLQSGPKDSISLLVSYQCRSAKEVAASMAHDLNTYENTGSCRSRGPTRSDVCGNQVKPCFS